MVSREPEFIVSGTVESGKSHPMLHRLYQLHCAVPNLVTFICRKKKVDMRKSIIDQFENEVLPYPVHEPRSPCRPYGGHNPSAYIWQNGGVTYVFGILEAKSLKGAQFDAGYVCQAEELTLDEWEFLAHRVGRAGNWLSGDGHRLGQIWADANPDVASHWVPKRVESGQMRMFQVGFEDNILFHRDGGWTDYGRERVEHLSSTMTGVRFRRLILGEWCSAEGLVFPEFDETQHVLDILPVGIERWDYYLGIDYGHSSPFVAAWFAHDRKTDTLICVKEWRYTNRLVEDYVTAIRRHSEGLNVIWRVADHDAQMNAQFRSAGIATHQADKTPGSILRGLDSMRLRLRTGRLKLYRHQLLERDPLLEERNALRDGIEEIARLRHKPIEQHVGDSEKDDLPLKGDDHWVDLCRYVVDKIDNRPRIAMDVHVGSFTASNFGR